MLVIDGRAVGRGCVALMVHVVDHGRALPIAWLVREGNKGHCPEEMHLAFVEEVEEVIPVGADVVFLGEEEFDGTELQKTLDDMGWSYVCRTALTTTATREGERFRLDRQYKHISHDAGYIRLRCAPATKPCCDQIAHAAGVP